MKKNVILVRFVHEGVEQEERERRKGIRRPRRSEGMMDRAHLGERPAEALAHGDVQYHARAVRRNDAAFVSILGGGHPRSDQI